MHISGKHKYPDMFDIRKESNVLMLIAAIVITAFCIQVQSDSMHSFTSAKKKKKERKKL